MKTGAELRFNRGNGLSGNAFLDENPIATRHAHAIGIAECFCVEAVSDLFQRCIEMVKVDLQSQTSECRINQVQTGGFVVPIVGQRWAVLVLLLQFGVLLQIQWQMVVDKGFVTVRKRPVANVVEQSSQLDAQFVHATNLQRRLLLLQLGQDIFREFGHAQTVFQAGVVGIQIDVIGRTQLFQMAKALQKGRIEYLP